MHLQSSKGGLLIAMVGKVLMLILGYREWITVRLRTIWLIINFDWLNSLYGLLLTRGRTNSRHDQDASGNRCAETRPKITDSIQCGGPDIKVDRLFYIHCAVFSISTKSLWKMSSKNCCLIDHLATNRHFPLNKTENIEEFWQARHTRYPSWQGFSLLVPPLL